MLLKPATLSNDFVTEIGHLSQLLDAEETGLHVFGTGSVETGREYLLSKLVFISNDEFDASLERSVLLEDLRHKLLSCVEVYETF